MPQDTQGHDQITTTITGRILLMAIFGRSMGDFHRHHITDGAWQAFTDDLAADVN
jgi:hypothetical protein